MKRESYRGESEKDSSLIHITADAEVLGASYMRDEEKSEKNPEKLGVYQYA